MSSHPPPSPTPQQQELSSGSSSPYSTSAQQFGDTTLTKVFVGGLAWETQRDSVRRYFEQFGEILEAVVITDKTTGRSKGYGFVTFRDPEGARRACADPTPVIDGRRANCNLASLGARSRPGTPQHGGRYRTGSPYAARSPGRIHQPLNGAATSYAQPLPYSYHQPFPYVPYGYSPYQQEYPYPANMYYVTPPPFHPQMFGGGPSALGSPTGAGAGGAGAGAGAGPGPSASPGGGGAAGSGSGPSFYQPYPFSPQQPLVPPHILPYAGGTMANFPPLGGAGPIPPLAIQSPGLTPEGSAGSGPPPPPMPQLAFPQPHFAASSSGGASSQQSSD